MLGIPKATLRFSDSLEELRTQKSWYSHGYDLLWWKKKMKISKGKSCEGMVQAQASSCPLPCISADGPYLSSQCVITWWNIAKQGISPKSWCPGIVGAWSHRCGLPTWLTSRPSKGQIDTTWPKTPTIHHNVSINYLAWPKAPQK